MKNPIDLTDWSRILVGDVPLSFFIEAIIRSVFIYILLITSMRLLGSRMASQMNATEMTAIVSLAAAIGIPLLSPDRGILPAAVIALVIVSIGRLSAYLSTRNVNTETLIDGHLNILVENGVLRFKDMKLSRITRERVFAQLRTLGFRHLGAVYRLYMESSGNFSVIAGTGESAGLSIIPDWDKTFVREQPTASFRVCHNCGARRTEAADAQGRCKNCGDTHWIDAVK
ncbi:MAG TPA: YetF domain-containing protein [Opitutaceae bacterium]